MHLLEHVQLHLLPLLPLPRRDPAESSAALSHAATKERKMTAQASPLELCCITMVYAILKIMGNHVSEVVKGVGGRLPLRSPSWAFFSTTNYDLV